MSERHMTEGEYALRLAASIADAEDNNRMVWSSTAGTVALARALISTSSAVRGMREALKPFADIALLRDTHRTAPDMIDAPDLAITPADVRKARAALSLVEGEDKQARSPSALSAPASNGNEGHD